MSADQPLVSTREFAEKAGVSTSTVSKWLRTGKIEGIKQGGKWRISPEELSKVSAAPAEGVEPAAKPQQPPAESQSGPEAISVGKFCEMTYLTEFGVRLWLREGRLKPAVDASGNPAVASSSIDDPMVKRLLR
jgi:excisionase family DNA binding protein